MRLLELTESVRSWTDIAQDAKSRGLKLVNQSKTKKPKYFLTPEDEIGDKVKSILNKAIDQSAYYSFSRDTFVSINTRNYVKVADKIEGILNDLEGWIELEKGKNTQKAWHDLELMKGDSVKFGRPGKYQLFLPRREAMDKRKKSNWVRDYDDQGNERKPVIEYKGSPVIPKTPTTTIGYTKPADAFWTSTLTKGPIIDDRQTYNSAWAEFVAQGHPEWWSPYGFVYTYDPSALFLQLDTTGDAQRIYDIFNRLHSKDLKAVAGQSYEMNSDFPWDEVAKHFDGVTHSGYGNFGGNWENFTAGWDVESTAWLNTSVLTLVGKVPITPVNRLQYDY